MSRKLYTINELYWLYLLAIIQEFYEKMKIRVSDDN